MQFVKFQNKKESYYKLTLQVKSNNSTMWSTKNKNILGIIHRIYPFFAIDTRRIDLYDWSKIWTLISQLKFLNMKELKNDELIKYIDDKISKKSGSYKDYVEKINEITSTSEYNYQEKVLNYVKVGLKGQSFNIEGEELLSQSDGTNSHKYLELFLSLMIALTRREFITPTVYVDEPEIGLHPKKSEHLIFNLFTLYESYKKTKPEREKGKYSTPNPKIIFSTHSPNIVKAVVKLFKDSNEHQVLHLKKSRNKPTSIRVIKSHYEDSRFLNIFSDNEARLFFSNFILFVEGETELEVFGNLKLSSKFSKLRDIDIYRANEVQISAINPSISNLPIPYLILYDSDVLLDPKHKLINGKHFFQINLKKSKINLSKIKKKCKFSYYSSKEYRVRNSIETITKNLSTDKPLSVRLPVAFEI